MLRLPESTTGHPRGSLTHPQLTPITTHPRTHTTGSADTILKGEEKVIGSVDIYTYGEEMAGLKKYKEKKMSGLSTIFFLFKGERVELNLAKDTLFFNAGKDTCTLVITEEMPKIQDIITPKKDKK